MSLHLFDTLLDAEMFLSKTVRNSASKSPNSHIKDLVYAKYNSDGVILCAIWEVYGEGGLQYGVSDFKNEDHSRGDDFSKIEFYLSRLEKFKTAIEIASEIQTLFGITHSFTKWVIVNMSHRNGLTISNCKVNNCLMYKKR